jgi:hypothetical protein
MASQIERKGPSVKHPNQPGGNLSPQAAQYCPTNPTHELLDWADAGELAAHSKAESINRAITPFLTMTTSAIRSHEIDANTLFENVCSTVMS